MTENLQDQNAPETSYSKGESFEKLFADFMKSDLGWDGVVIRSQQKSGPNSKGSQVDIIGKRQDKRGKKLEIIGILYGAIMIILMVIGVIDVVEELVYFGLFMGIVGVVSIYISKGLHRENAWVECKNRKTKSTYDDVRKSIEEFKGYKESGDKEFKYVVHYFVSANGFVENALKYATDNGLICYEMKDGKFVVSTYWK